MESNQTIPIRNWIFAAFVVGLTGCATYQGKPLSDHAAMPSRYADITVDRSQMPLPELAAHMFNADGGLDMDDIAMLAVVNNPDLKVARADARVSHAQAFAAGLLPDPQIACSGQVISDTKIGGVAAICRS